MKVTVTDGINPTVNPFMTKRMVVRTEKTGKFATLSITDEDEGVMLQIAISDEVKKQLKEVLE